MITVYLINFDYALAMCSTLEEAVELAKRAGFEASFIKDGRTFATWSPISGYKDL